MFGKTSQKQQVVSPEKIDDDDDDQVEVLGVKKREHPAYKVTGPNPDVLPLAEGQFKLGLTLEDRNALKIQGSLIAGVTTTA